MFNCHAGDKMALIVDPEVLAIPIHENHEPLVDLKHQKEIAYRSARKIPYDSHYTKVRKTVYDKLKEAQALLPKGLTLCLYEGYRSLELQQRLFQVRYENLRKINPTMSHEQLFMETTKFVSPVINLDGSKNIPAHSTGGAIDVALLDQKGNAVDMGLALDKTFQDADGSLSKTDSQVISEEAKEYRKIMNKALQAVGFVNYPTEYWHWSYGDRYWAHQTNHKYAIYGSAPL